MEIRDIFVRTIFITGTDTGVGKTLLTSLLLCHLRGNGGSAVAMKPFSSGSREDAELLHAIPDGGLTLEEINPFHFPEPLAPLVAARKQRRRIPLEAVLESIELVKSAMAPLTPSARPSTLLIEGAGGLLAPLGKNYSATDLILALRCSVIIVARNQLGTLNHTLLTARALALGFPAIPSLASLHSRLSFRSRRTVSTSGINAKVVLMNARRADISSRSNPAVLSELLPGLAILSIPFLGKNASQLVALSRAAKLLTPTLARILEEHHPRR